MAKELFTIGYEGINVDNFVNSLKKYSVSCLIDVREIPLSRKPGFSKTGLAQRLNQADIRYVHFKQLGSPKTARNKLKLDKDYMAFFSLMEKYLTDRQDVIEKAYRYVEDETCCLMCFEHLPQYCHRSIVAAKIKECDGNGLRVNNI